MLGATLVFNFVVNATYSAFIWLFISEMLGRRGVAIVAAFDFLAAIIFGSMANKYFEWYSEESVFFTLFFVQLAAMLFFTQIVKETKDKPAAERHAMYLPRCYREKLAKPKDVEMKEL